ncbi:MAG: hypothetical protein KGJ43_07565, partial [Acidobacteriota bacterium]|nr:hypothetical protein [Acidobacteriota bacterium]
MNRSLARRDHAARRGGHAGPFGSLARSAVPGAGRGTAPAFAGIRSEPLVPRLRDLGDDEPWELSLGRSRARRRAAELRFVPSANRARRLSLGTVAALAVGLAANLGEAGAAQRSATPVPTSP